MEGIAMVIAGETAMSIGVESVTGDVVMRIQTMVARGAVTHVRSSVLAATHVRASSMNSSTPAAGMGGAGMATFCTTSPTFLAPQNRWRRRQIQ
jgi:hypothetical protein